MVEHICMSGTVVNSMNAKRLLQTVRDRIQIGRITPQMPPITRVDDCDRTVQYRPYTDEDFESLVAMYDAFDPADRAQGVPPAATADVREWLTDILDGENVVACCDDRIVGHVSFVPDGTGRHELAIFVHQDYQRAGIGSTLLGAGMGHAKRNGVTYVWLSVERSNYELVGWYTRAGFSVVNPLGITHRMSRYL